VKTWPAERSAAAPVGCSAEVIDIGGGGETITARTVQLLWAVRCNEGNAVLNTNVGKRQRLVVASPGDLGPADVDDITGRSLCGVADLRA